VISAEEERRCQNEEMAIAQMGQKHVPSTTSKDDLLAERDQRQAAGEIDETQRPVESRIDAEYCHRKGRTDHSFQTDQTDTRRHNAGDPQGDLPQRQPPLLAAERDRSRGWNCRQYSECTEPPSVIPEDPARRIVLMQSQDLRGNHWKKRNDEPDGCHQLRIIASARR